MLQKGDGATQVFGENLTAATPTWPSTMQEWQARQPRPPPPLSGVGQAMTGSGTSLLGNMVGSLQQSATQAIVQLRQPGGQRRHQRSDPAGEQERHQAPCSRPTRP